MAVAEGMLRKRTYHLSGFWLLPLSIFLLGLALRLYCLDCATLWYDEVASIEIAQHGLSSIFTERFGWVGNQTPWHYVLVWLTIQPMEPAISSALVRSPSALAGACIPLVVYGLGREMMGKLQGALAAYLAAFLPVLHNYSQDVRPYALLTLFTILSAYFLLKAKRGNDARYWLAFAAITVMNLLNSYLALVLVMPVIGLYVLYVLGELWLVQGKRGKSLMPAVLSLMTVALISAFTLLDSWRAKPQYGLPDLSQFALTDLIALIVGLLAWLTQTGLGAQVDSAAAVVGMALAMFGGYAWLRSRAYRDALLLILLFILVPTCILAILRSSNVLVVLTERYLIFLVPFYLLLIARTLAFVLANGAGNRLGVARIARTFAAAIAAPILLVVTVAGFHHATSPSYDRVEVRPDYKSVAAYLSNQTSAEDTVVFIGIAPHAVIVSHFYWRGNPPTVVYDGVDPRLFRHEPKGDIYWVVLPVQSATVLAEDPMRVRQGWAEVVQLSGAVIARQRNPQANMVGNMRHAIETFRAILPTGYPAIELLKGCIYQAEGKEVEAISSYRQVDGGLPLAREHLRTANGFLASGKRERAWQEAMLSKYDYPANPDLHWWMAEELRNNGYVDESEIETRIAELLQSVFK